MAVHQYVSKRYVVLVMHEESTTNGCGVVKEAPNHRQIVPRGSTQLSCQLSWQKERSVLNRISLIRNILGLICNIKSRLSNVLRSEDFKSITSQCFPRNFNQAPSSKAFLMYLIVLCSVCNVYTWF